VEVRLHFSAQGCTVFLHLDEGVALSPLNGLGMLAKNPSM
jgi:hypothetical protein